MSSEYFTEMRKTKRQQEAVDSSPRRASRKGKGEEEEASGGGGAECLRSSCTVYFSRVDWLLVHVFKIKERAAQDL